MKEINEFDNRHGSDLEILENIVQEIKENGKFIRRGIEILTEDLRRRDLELDIPEHPDDTYGKANETS